MIEKMKKVTVLSEGSRRKELLSRLREAGVMHISDIVQKAPSAAPLEEERAEYQRILQVLSERRDKKNRSRTLVTGAAFDGVHPGIKEAVDSEAALKDRIIALQNERERIIPFGDFDPDATRLGCNCLSGGIVDGYTITEGSEKGIDFCKALEKHDASQALWNTDNGIWSIHNISIQDLIFMLVMDHDGSTE